MREFDCLSSRCRSANLDSVCVDVARRPTAVAVLDVPSLSYEGLGGTRDIGIIDRVAKLRIWV